MPGVDSGMIRNWGMSKRALGAVEVAYIQRLVLGANTMSSVIVFEYLKIENQSSAPVHPFPL